MDEGSGHDDTSAEVPGEEVNVERYAESRHSFGYHRKEGGKAGEDHDDE